MRILVLDSGLGGLTVLSSILLEMPDLTFDYVADNGFFPYGTKSESELYERIFAIVTHLLKKNQYDAIVVACNSASTQVLEQLREKVEIPIVGVVPAIKPAAKVTSSKRIGVLATQGTVSGGYLKRLIADFASDCDVKAIAAPSLVNLAEGLLRGQSVSDNQLVAIIQPLLEAQVDTVVLGCTHFPWFKARFSQIAPNIKWLDSGEAIAKRVKSILSNKKNVNRKPSVFFYSGGAYQSLPQFINNENRLNVPNYEN